MKLVWVLVSPLVLALLVVGALTGPLTGSGSAQAIEPVASESLSANAVTPLGFYWQLTSLQPVLPGTVLVPRGVHKKAEGTRSDKQFFQISSTGSNDVPQAALRAYHHAEAVMAKTDPGCQISWTLLAAIGRVESNHGRFGGAQLGADGVSRPGIVGPQLNGSGAFAAIPDTDHGVLDGDKKWDRAVGQMQFLPSTWRVVARDGDGDGKMNPNDIDDSAMAAAVYLCGAGGSLADQAGMARAAYRYNHSDYYVQLVLSFQSGYQTGVFSVPSPPPPPAAKPKAATHKTRQHLTSKPKHVAVPAAPKPSTPAKPTVPTPTPKPTPKPTPASPKLVQVDGTWNACGPAYCLGTTVLDLGPQSTAGDAAAADFDGDGTVETNSQEFAGLVDQHVTLQVVKTGGGFQVFVIGGKGLRNADGSFARAMATSATAAPTS